MSLTNNTAAIFKIPAVVQKYFAAANRSDARQAAACFTTEAIVHDEDRDYQGRQGILAWVTDTIAKYQPTFTLLRASVEGARVKLAVAVAGRFPGSPVTLAYEFLLRGKRISTLTIA
jgi:ketosteroid isomerase-like protein